MITKVTDASGWGSAPCSVASTTRYSVNRNELDEPFLFGRIEDAAYWCGRCDGFAEVFHNVDSGDLVLIRDHVGLEPLYYYCRNGVVIFGSNLPDILSKLPVPPAYNHEQIITLVERNQVYTDETLYQHIFRAEPGAITKISAIGGVTKSLFWQLDPEASDIVLPNDEAYLDRFSKLMHEAVGFCTDDKPEQLCAKMSGGLDSGSIFITAAQQGLSFPLFMHIASKNSHLVDDKKTACEVLNRFGHADIHFITADQFDPIAAFDYCAKQFAGPAPYILFMHMYHLYCAIVKSGKRIILSGAGGDECVSGHASNSVYFNSVFKQYGHKALWRALSEIRAGDSGSMYAIKKIAALLRVTHPSIYNFFAKTASVDWFVRRVIRRQINDSMPFKTNYSKTVREYEWDKLQGPNSHHVRMRVEYNAVLARSMGLEFRYPLLYPKLVEFCFRLPLNQKRRDGVGRYMMRQYLKKSSAPKDLYSQSQKQGGIIPGTLDKCYNRLKSGNFSEYFTGLPYMQYADCSTTHRELAQKTMMYMLKHAQ